MIYTGDLSVEPNEFNLRVDRMIVRHKQISFDCYGRMYSDRSPWHFSGVAFLQPEGHYKADKVEDVDGTEVQTTVYIFKPKCSVDSCSLEGFWYEKTRGYDPEVYRFSGCLDPF